MNEQTYPVVLSIAASDSCGGAGIQADLKTISAAGGYAATAVTAITAQNTQGINSIYLIPADMLKRQIETVLADLDVSAIKIGMIGNCQNLQVITEILRRENKKIVVFDPVMSSTSGSSLMKEGLTECICQELMPLLDFITPNIPEAEILTNRPITDINEMYQAARCLQEMGATNVYLKGGHWDGNIGTDLCLFQSPQNLQDLILPQWVSESGLQIMPFRDAYILKSPYIASRNTHGTGCTLASCLSTRLAMNESPLQATVFTKAYIHEAIAGGTDFKIGHGNGPLCHFPLSIFTQKS